MNDKSKCEFERELEEEVKGITPQEKRKFLEEVADYFLIEYKGNDYPIISEWSRNG